MKATEFDATVIVRDGRAGLAEIAANRAVLSADSTYFARRFSLDTTRTVAVEDVAADAVRILISVCHDPSSLAKNTPKSMVAQAAYDLAVQFGFVKTRKHLLRLRILTGSDREQCRAFEKEWGLAETANSQELWDGLARRFNLFYMSALSRRNLIKVLESPQIILGYRDVLRVILEWKKMHPKESKLALDDFLRIARFEALSTAELGTLINNDAMPYSCELQNDVEKNRRFLAFSDFIVKDGRGFETVHKILIPNVEAPLNSPIESHFLRNGVAYITLPLTQESIYRWDRSQQRRHYRGQQYEQRADLIVARLPITVGPFAVSIWLFAKEGSLCGSVVIDRRLNGNKELSLQESLSEYKVQCLFSSKTKHIERGKFDRSILTPAGDAARSATMAEGRNDWEGAATCKIIHMNDVQNIMYSTNRGAITLETLVDVRLVVDLRTE